MQLILKLTHSLLLHGSNLKCPIREFFFDPKHLMRLSDLKIVQLSKMENLTKTLTRSRNQNSQTSKNSTGILRKCKEY